GPSCQVVCIKDCQRQATGHVEREIQEIEDRGVRISPDVRAIDQQDEEASDQKLREPRIPFHWTASTTFGSFVRAVPDLRVASENQPSIFCADLFQQKWPFPAPAAVPA